MKSRKGTYIGSRSNIKGPQRRHKIWNNIKFMEVPKGFRNRKKRKLIRCVCSPLGKQITLIIERLKKMANKGINCKINS